MSKATINWRVVFNRTCWICAGVGLFVYGIFLLDMVWFFVRTASWSTHQWVEYGNQTSAYSFALPLLKSVAYMQLVSLVLSPFGPAGKRKWPTLISIFNLFLIFMLYAAGQ